MTLDLAADSEKGGLLLHLLQICQAPERTGRGVPALIGRLVPARRAARRRDDERAAADAQRLVLENWHRLPTAARRVALAIREADWRHHLARMLDAESPELDAAVAFLTDERSAEGTPPSPVDPRVIRALFASGDRRAAELAEREVLPLLLAGVRTPPALRPPALLIAAGTDEPDADERRVLRTAAAAARAVLDTTDTPGPRLALAALALLDRPATDPAFPVLDPLTAVLADPAHPAFPALRRALKRDRSPMTRRLAWRLLGDHPLALAALERLRADATDAEHDAVLERAHLLGNPTRVRALAGARARRNASLGPAALAPVLPPRSAALAPAAERGLARLLACADDRAASDLHDRLLAANDGRARLAAARHATGNRITDYCLDADPAVALTAALRRSGLGVTRAGDRPAEHRVRMTRALARSPHAAVRRIAEQDIAHAELLSETGDPSPRARALARSDPAALAERLAALLDPGDAGSGVPAIRAIARLGLAGDLAERLAGFVAEGHDPRLAATAAAALGSVPGRLALEPLDAALAHADARVRANAVESLERVSRSTDINPIDRLTEVKASPEHRARANALRALERLRLADDGATHDEASRMLFDPRAHHRLAAVWLAERLLCDPRSAHTPRDAAWQAVARGVAALARTEDDDHIRARALRCARRLRAEIRRPTADPAVAHATQRLRHAARRGAAAEGVPA